MRYCTQCGAASEANDAFCAQCGGPLGTEGAGRPAGTAPGGSEAPPAYGLSGGYGGAPIAPHAGPGQLADWGTRFIGFLIDFALLFVLSIVGVMLGRVSVALQVIIDLVVFAASVYLAIQVGQTGQSPGMRVMGLKCIGIQTGQPIGAGLGFVRAIAHIVDSIICYIGWLFPLWDRNRQTLADKIMSTVVIVVPKQAFSLTPPA